jgi:Tfp pilus assembly protein PilO
VSLWRRVFDERKHVVLPLVIVLVANVAIFALAVVPLRSVVANANSQALDATLELAQARRLLKQARDARASRTRADAELHRFYTAVLPRDQPTAVKTTNLWLNEAARSAGLVFRASHFDVTDVRDSRLARAFATVTLQGRYANIRRFLYEVEQAQEFILVERVELTQSGAQPGANGLLEISLVVSTYFVKPGA